jgi:polo-like kinase 1
LGKGIVFVDNLLGGFAKCYEGVNIETKKLYAIKVIDKNTLQKNRAKQKVLSLLFELLSEIKIHKTLHHDYIVEFDSVF